MSLQDTVFNITIIVFILTTIAFAIRYCKLLTVAQKEYERAKDIVSGIVFTFKRNQDKQNETIEQLTLQVEAAQSAVERLTNYFQGIENKFKNLVTITESTPEIYKDAIEQVNLIKKDVDRISENQENLRKQINTLEEKAQTIGKSEQSPAIVSESQPFSKLTETERVVLQFLMNEGAKSAPEVEQKIGKTREHTARLMKKLWQEGYIERDTHRIPYFYRITESLKKMEIKA